MTKYRLKIFTKVLVFLSALIFMQASSALSEERYLRVYALFKGCSLGFKIDGQFLIADECKSIFEDVYSTTSSSTLESFNQSWVNSGGETTLTQSLVTEESQFGSLNRLTGIEARVRDDFFKQISPNWLGKRKLDKAGAAVVNYFDTLSPMLYSQLSKCFSKSHVNARLVREIISKKNFLKTNKPSLSEKQIALMQKSVIFSVNNTKDCDALESAMNTALPTIISRLKKEILKSNPVKRECKKLAQILSNETSFNVSNYSGVCAEHYKANFERILPLANDIMSEIEQQKLEKDRTSSEQLIK